MKPKFLIHVYLHIILVLGLFFALAYTWWLFIIKIAQIINLVDVINSLFCVHYAVIDAKGFLVTATECYHFAWFKALFLSVEVLLFSLNMVIFEPMHL